MSCRTCQCPRCRKRRNPAAFRERIVGYSFRWKGNFPRVIAQEGRWLMCKNYRATPFVITVEEYHAAVNEEAASLSNVRERTQLAGEPAGDSGRPFQPGTGRVTRP